MCLEGLQGVSLQPVHVFVPAQAPCACMGPGTRVCLQETMRAPIPNVAQLAALMQIILPIRTLPLGTPRASAHALQPDWQFTCLLQWSPCHHLFAVPPLYVRQPDMQLAHSSLCSSCLPLDALQPDWQLLARVRLAVYKPGGPMAMEL
eukprot:scaffold69421_cov24-Tisochrysis_lutea.AAC.2